MSNEEEKVEKCNCTDCDNYEICRRVGKFLFLAGAVFLGTFLALVLANALNKPKVPNVNGMRGQRPGIERQRIEEYRKYKREQMRRQGGNAQRFDKQNPPRVNGGDPRKLNR